MSRRPLYGQGSFGVADNKVILLCGLLWRALCRSLCFCWPLFVSFVCSPSPHPWLPPPPHPPPPPPYRSTCHLLFTNTFMPPSPLPRHFPFICTSARSRSHTHTHTHTRERGRERKCVCVCVCVCERERACVCVCVRDRGTGEGGWGRGGGGVLLSNVFLIKYVSVFPHFIRPSALSCFWTCQSGSVHGPDLGKRKSLMAPVGGVRGHD